MVTNCKKIFSKLSKVFFSGSFGGTYCVKRNPFIWTIFLAGPFLILWMVWAVLAAPVEIKETFEEQWYQDRKDLGREQN
jgi:hypothetical protein